MIESVASTGIVHIAPYGNPRIPRQRGAPLLGEDFQYNDLCR